jgi:hypothetical protein
MATEAELQTQIGNLEALVNTGASTIAQDGHTTVFDLEFANKRLRALRQELATKQNKTTRRPIFNRINLS